MERKSTELKRGWEGNRKREKDSKRQRSENTDALRDEKQNVCT